jgi:hypothetical protein
MRISNDAAIAMCDALVDLLDAGAGAGYIEIRTGSQPATVETAASGTLLATLALSDPAFGDAADDDPGAKATANAISDDTSADNTGTAGWFRAYDSDDTAIIDGSAGTSGTDLILDDASIVSGQTVKINSWTVTMPEA